MKQNPVTISIAIPAFERTDFLQAAIQSCLSQTHPPTEVIVVDNGSKHNRIKRIALSIEGVKYFRNEENIGMFGNWNRCVAISSSEYVMILGDDDILQPNFIETVVQTIVKRNRPDLVFTDFEVFGGSQAATWKARIPIGELNGSTIREFTARRGLFFPVISSVIRRSTFSPFYEEIHTSNDWRWSIMMPDEYRCYGISDALVRYRKHGNGDSERAVFNNLMSHACLYWHLFSDRNLSPIARWCALVRSAAAIAKIEYAGQLLHAVEYFESVSGNWYIRQYSGMRRSLRLKILWQLILCVARARRRIHLIR
ncbi:MAG: hypothetical protein CL725_08370 [Chloroflexi bacterium]|nr:hypothetical protein [Chloroflexota bacterium]|tara:strand:+ start:10243 stop:11175 length:933 start_codon:yes stop_codon:yes gene_type:complete